MNATAPLRFLILGSLLATGLCAQSPVPKIDFPAPSPTGSREQRVGLTDIEGVYSRPGVKGRNVFGPANALAAAEAAKAPQASLRDEYLRLNDALIASLQG